jgi:hypothetical protein
LPRFLIVIAAVMLSSLLFHNYNRHERGRQVRQFGTGSGRNHGPTGIARVIAQNFVAGRQWKT